jgi:hypothetical protein
MSEAYICDITGKPVEGLPPGRLELDFGDRKVQVRLFVRKDKSTFVQGSIGPEASEQIKAALAKIVGKR